MKKQKSITKSSYKKWKAIKYTLYGGTYVCPLIPAVVITGLNWSDWFAGDNSWSIGLGFGSLLLSVIVTIVGITKRDKILSDKVSPLYSFAVILACWAIVLLFLASITSQLGYMMLYTCLGLAGGATCDQARKLKVDKEVDFYKQLVIDNDLDEKLRKQKEKREKARQEAINEAKRRAIE